MVQEMRVQNTGVSQCQMKALDSFSLMFTICSTQTDTYTTVRYTQHSCQQRKAEHGPCTALIITTVTLCIITFEMYSASSSSLGNLLSLHAQAVHVLSIP